MKNLALILISAFIYSFAMEAQVTQTITDADGNNYNTVKIGNQLWMAENLKTTKYNDGTSIPLVVDNTAWASLNTPAYCWYNNDAATYKATYGALYNWFVVDPENNGNKNVCPLGWHVPSDADWTILTNYLGGLSVAGGKMKEAGTAHWLSPNTGATNESGFTALPTGLRYSTDGSFDRKTISTDIRSSTMGTTTNSWKRGLYYLYDQVYDDNGYSDKQYGLSVRCVFDSSISTQPLANLDSGLVAYYPFNGNANDESGNGNNGTVNGATLTTDRFNNNSCYEFKKGSYIIVPDSKQLALKDNYSISVWINPYSENLYNDIITKWDEKRCYVLTLKGNVIDFIVGTDGIDQNDLIGKTLIKINSWSYLDVVYMVDTLKIFVNGSLDTKFSFSKNPFIWTNQLYIGSTGFGAFPFNGKIDDIRIYDRALNDKEIDSLYKVNTVTSINFINKENLWVCPNPVVDFLKIGNSVGLKNPTVDIYNIVGKLIYSQKLNPTQNSINVSSFSNGTYILKVIDINNTFTKKFIKR